jgi:hypothetical protein
MSDSQGQPEESTAREVRREQQRQMHELHRAQRRQTHDARRQMRKVEYSLNLGQLGDQMRSQLANLEEHATNWFGETVPQSDEVMIRRSVEQQFKKRGEFVAHLVVFVAINVLLWGLFLFGQPLLNGADAANWVRFAGAFPWPLLVTLGWGAGLAAHGVDVYNETGDRALMRERLIRQALR